MAYIYESIQNGVVNFTIPGTGKTVKLFRGAKVTVDQKLAGGYLRVLKFVGETVDEVVAEVATKQTAKVADKITKVEEVVAPVVDVAAVVVEDAVTAVKEEEVVVEDAPLDASAKKNSKKK